MTSIADEFNSINKTQVKEGGGGLSFETTPGRYLCRVESVELSPKDHQGTPYFLMKMKSQNDKELNTKLWRAKTGDDATKKNNKEVKIKKFLSDAGIDLSVTKGENVLKEIIGKSLKCMFTAEEYIGIDKKNGNKPCVKTSLSLWYTDNAEAEMSPISEDKAYRKLNVADEQKLQGELGVWNMNNGGSSVQQASQQADTQEDVDELPF